MTFIYSLKRSIEKTVANRGVKELIFFLLSKIVLSIKNLIILQGRHSIQLKNTVDMEFDKKYGVDTAGIIPISKLDVKNKNWIYGVRYQAIGNIDFGQLLNDLNLTYSKFVFIDYGSGKGRALLLASILPFKKILGVEFSQELIDIAQNNLFHYPENIKKCTDIELVCMDATAYDLPKEPLVIYFYNPFQRPVMEHVINNVIKSFQKQPRRIIIIYVTPEYVELLNNVKFLKKVKEMSNVCIFDTPQKLIC